MAMNTSKKLYQSDSKGIVHVDVVVGTPGQSVEVDVTWEEVADGKPAANAAGEDWSDLYGLLRDEPLQRAPQGQYEKRDGLT
jgi:hypothetical protein